MTMRFDEYCFGSTGSLSDLDFRDVAANAKGVVETGMPRDFLDFAFARLDGGRMLVASPFGALSFPVEDGRVLLGTGGGISRARGRESWSWLSGELVSEGELLRARRDGSAIVPLGEAWSFKGEGEKRRSGLTLFLPGIPKSSRESEAGLVLSCQGGDFLLPAGRWADLYARGLATIYVPGRDGFFDHEPAIRGA